MTAREVLLPPSPTPTLPDLCRVAAEAVTVLCATLHDCAREVENRGGYRLARNRLTTDREAAVDALKALGRKVPVGDRYVEVWDIAAGCQGGYVRETWALRLMQFAAAAPEPRDTVPTDAPEEHAGEGGT